MSDKNSVKPNFFCVGEMLIKIRIFQLCDKIKKIKIVSKIT